MQEEYIKNNVEQKNETEENFFTLQTLIALILTKWHWFLISVILCCTLAAFYIGAVHPVFELHSQVLIKGDEKKGMNSELTDFLELGGMSGGNKIQNELYVFQSSPLIGEVVRRLHLDVTYRTKKTFRYQELFETTPLHVSFLDAYTHGVRFIVSPISADSCLLSKFVIYEEGAEKEIDTRQMVPFYLPVSTPVGTFETSLITKRSVVAAASVTSKL